MKVLCVNKGNFEWVSGRRVESPLVEGDEYVVMWDQQEPEGLYYALAEFGDDIGFLATLFIPISDVCETEMEREYNKALI